MEQHSNVHAGHARHLPSTGRALTISAWLTGLYFIIEMAIGLWTGSVAVISDAFHTFSAVGGILVAIVAARISKRPADEKKTFGWYRAEVIGALVNGAFLLSMAIIVIVMGVMRLWDPIELATGPMIAAAVGGLITEFISLYLLYRQQGNDLNVRGAYWHVIQTFVGSLIILLTAAVIHLTGFLAIDPILGTAFGLVLLWASWGILREASHLLMDGTPNDISISEVKHALESLDSIQNVHHIHGWALTSGRYVFSAHIRMADDEVQTDAVIGEADALLRERYGFFFTTLQLERSDHDESHADAIEALN